MITKTYPSQTDCQVLIDIMNRPNIYYSACQNADIKKIGIKVNEYPTGWKKTFDKAFGTKSPWNVKVVFGKGGFGKRVLFWDKEKANKLGI